MARPLGKVTYVPDHEGLQAYLMGSDVRNMLMARARGAAQYAQRIAPVETGEYAASIHAEDGGIGGKKHDRAMVRIVATADHSAAVEWGNARHHTASHVLRQAGDVAEKG